MTVWHFWNLLSCTILHVLGLQFLYNENWLVSVLPYNPESFTLDTHEEQLSQWTFRWFHGSQCAKSKCHLVNKHCSVETMWKYCNVSVNHTRHQHYLLFFFISLQKNISYKNINIICYNICYSFLCNSNWTGSRLLRLFTDYFHLPPVSRKLSPSSVFYWPVDLWRDNISACIYKSICLCVLVFQLIF